MGPGAGRDDRFSTLLDSVEGLRGAVEKRAFLEAVCGDAPGLIEDVLKTASMADSQPRTVTLEYRPGQIVAERFSIVRKLGEGGMAIVYEALDEKLGERRALKFSKAGHARHIPPEARNALRITHDNICRIHEIHSIAPGAGDFISMEFIDGVTLLERSRGEAFSQGEVLNISRQLCAGLEAAHRAEILHRDLKGNNVMLTERADGSMRVVIMDFGLARQVGRRRRADSARVSGTPNYIAPELWRGAPPSAKSDVYSLGMVLFEMLTGTFAFPEGEAGVAWRKRLAGGPEAPSKSPRKCDARWDAIVRCCLEPDPAQRFGSAAEVLANIERSFRVSHRRAWIAAAAVGLLGISAVGYWRDSIFAPPPLARLAVLPFPSADAQVGAAVNSGLQQLGRRLESLGGDSRRVVVMPPAAETRPGTTHALSGTVTGSGAAIGLKAVVTELKSGSVVREFSGDFQEKDLAGISTTLAGVVTSAFHLRSAPPAAMKPEAFPAYAAGLEHLRQAPAQLDEAVRAFETAQQLDDGSPLIHGGLAEAFAQKFLLEKDGHWLRRAASAAHRAESLQPDSPPVLLALGVIEEAEGRPERAIDLFRRAAELEPKNSEAARRTGQALQRIGRDNEALAALKTAIELAPDYYKPHLGMGNTLFRMSRFQEAADEYRLVTTLAPELPEGFTYLGGALIAAEDEGNAERALRRSIQLKVSWAALNNLSVLLRYQGRNAEAVEVLRQGLSLGADDTTLRLNLANALRRMGRKQEARENFQKASEMAREVLLRNPRDSSTRARLAYAMAQLGKRESAGDEALQAAKLAKTDYSAQFWAVMTLETLGRRGEALPLLEYASYSRLRDLQRQPDLKEFTREPGFLALLQNAKTEVRKGK